MQRIHNFPVNITLKSSGFYCFQKHNFFHKSLIFYPFSASLFWGPSEGVEFKYWTQIDTSGKCSRINILEVVCGIFFGGLLCTFAVSWHCSNEITSKICVHKTLVRKKEFYRYRAMRGEEWESQKFDHWINLSAKMSHRQTFSTHREIENWNYIKSSGGTGGALQNINCLERLLWR